jgi:hypothetical protein
MPFGAFATGVGGWFANGAASTVGTIGTGYGIVVAWLIGVPRRAGHRLFSMNDEEARWQRWQVTETLGGLGRRYRDPRFDALKVDESLRRHGTRANANGPDDTGCPLGGAG